MLGQVVSLKGKAYNSKGGAVLVMTSDEVIYIEGLDYWEDSHLESEMFVKGLLKQVKYIPDPVVDDDGAISQGAEGKQYVLEDAEW